MAADKTFLGTGWSFPPRFSSKGVTLVSAEQDIRESLFILLSTTPGERIMQPNYGCALRAHVFDNISEGTIAVIKDIVQKAILFFEPRVIVDHIDVHDEEKLEGKISLNIHYTVRSTNNRYNLVYPFYFSEGTNVQL